MADSAAFRSFGVADNFTGLVEFLPAALIGLYRADQLAKAGGAEHAHPRAILITGMLALWSLRLGTFLLGRMFSRSGPVTSPNPLFSFLFPRPVVPR